jgi:hypothetical protein
MNREAGPEDRDRGIRTLTFADPGAHIRSGHRTWPTLLR